MKKLHHVYATINKTALLRNLNVIQTFVGDKKILAILKKDAYGHGLVEIGKVLTHQVDYIGVIYPEEGIQLRQAGIDTAILVLGAVLPIDIADCIQHNLEFALFSDAQFDEIKRLNPSTAKVHLKIDTGMGRIGLAWDDADSFIQKVVYTECIQIKGIFTHLACADTPNHPFSVLQANRFKKSIQIFIDNNWEMPLLHVAASGGILHYPETHFDMVRPGHILYGVYPDKDAEQVLDIQPVLSLYATVLFSKRVKKGETVGYGNVFIAPKDIWISTISIGYGDGYPRELTAKGKVIVRDQFFPISSSVCMDQLMVATGDLKLNIGEEVTLIGKSPNHQITTDETAVLCNTVPDKILTSIHSSIPKNYII